jgi:hypothetical protein
MYKKITTSRKNKNKVKKLLSNKKNKNNIRLIIKKSKRKLKSKLTRKKNKSTSKSKPTRKKSKRKLKSKSKSTKKHLKKNLKGGFYGKPFFQGINETGYGIESALTDTMSGLKGEPLSTSYDVTLQPDLKVSPDITDMQGNNYLATKSDYENVVKSNANASTK